jgi:hypothetical protein
MFYGMTFHGIVLCYDCTNPKSLMNLHGWLADCLTTAQGLARAREHPASPAAPAGGGGGGGGGGGPAPLRPMMTLLREDYEHAVSRLKAALSRPTVALLQDILGGCEPPPVLLVGVKADEMPRGAAAPRDPRLVAEAGVAHHVVLSATGQPWEVKEVDRFLQTVKARKWTPAVLARAGPARTPTSALRREAGGSNPLAFNDPGGLL